LDLPFSQGLKVEGFDFEDTPSVFNAMAKEITLLNGCPLARFHPRASFRPAACAAEPFKHQGPANVLGGRLMDNQTFTLINIAVMTGLMWFIPLQFIPFFICWNGRKRDHQDRIGPNALKSSVSGFSAWCITSPMSSTFNERNITPTRPTVFYYLLAPFWSHDGVAFAAAGDSSGRAHGNWAGHTLRFSSGEFQRGGSLYSFHHQHGVLE